MIVQVVDYQQFAGVIELGTKDGKVVVLRTAGPDGTPDTEDMQNLVHILKGYMSNDPDPLALVQITNRMTSYTRWVPFDGSWADALTHGRSEFTGRQAGYNRDARRKLQGL